jgi:hypothetical protein
MNTTAQVLQLRDPPRLKVDRPGDGFQASKAIIGQTVRLFGSAKAKRHKFKSTDHMLGA